MSAAAGTAGSAPRTRAALLWSEHGFVAAVLCAAAITVDPLGWDLGSDRVLKHLPLALALVFALLTAVGRRLRAAPGSPRPGAGLVRGAWPLALLAAFIVAGSLYERVVGGVRDTFLNVGLYMPMTFVAAAAVRDSEAPRALLRAVFGVLLAAGTVMGALLIANYGVRQVYHEQIFLVIPLAVLCLAVPRRSALHWLGGAFFLAMAWFSQKFTSYGVGALTAAYLLAALWLPRLAARAPLQRTALAYWTLLLAAGGGVLVLWLMLTHRASLPSGNLEYRLHTYAQAWHSFTDSPLWGSMFAAEAVRKFTLYTIGIAGNLLPTHSDILDLLANGGLLGITLWALGLAMIARAALQGPLAPRRLAAPEAPYAHALAMISIAALLTYAFNPILLQPALAFLVWTCLGLLYGIALRGRESVAVRKRVSASGLGNLENRAKTYS